MAKKLRRNDSPELPEAPPPNPQSRWARLAFTFVPPILVLLARQIALPYVDAAEIKRRFPSSVTDNYSIVALGIMPFLTAAILVEVVAVLVPRWRHIRHSGAIGRAELQRATNILTILLAAFQGYSIATWLRSGDWVIGIGYPPLIIITMTLMASVMLMKLIADFITIRGLANGYTVFLCTSLITEVIGAIRAPEFALAGTIGGLPWKIIGVAFWTWVVLERLPLPSNGEAAERPPETQKETGQAETKVENPYAAPNGDALVADVEEPKRKSDSLNLPIPASGLVPYSITQTLVFVPAATAAWFALAEKWAYKLQDQVIRALVSISLVFSLTWLFTWIFHQPKNVAEVYGRLDTSKGGRGRIAAEARDAVRHSTAYSLLYVLGLLVIEFATKKTPLSIVQTTVIALTTAMVVDLVKEFIAIGARRDLVLVWPEHRSYAIGAAQQALEAAGIFMHVRDERQRRLMQFAAPYIPMGIYVPQKDAARASRILRDVLLAKRVTPTTKLTHDELVIDTSARQRPVSKSLIAFIGLLAFMAFWLALPKPPSHEELKAARTTKLEFVLLDDDQSIVDEVADESLQSKYHVRIQAEQVSVGPGKQAVRKYAAVEKDEGETLEAARGRLESWIQAIKLPQGTRAAIAEYQTYDEDLQKLVVIGWRTYLLKGPAILTEKDIAEAQAMLDSSNRAADGWLVRLTFKPEGAERFEQVTAENIKRRFAILLDGLVQSAPVIQTRIPGGIATITMGNHDSGQQQTDAKNLEKALNGY